MSYRPDAVATLISETAAAGLRHLSDGAGLSAALADEAKIGDRRETRVSPQDQMVSKKSVTQFVHASKSQVGNFIKRHPWVEADGKVWLNLFCRWWYDPEVVKRRRRAKKAAIAHREANEREDLRRQGEIERKRANSPSDSGVTGSPADEEIHLKLLKLATTAGAFPATLPRIVQAIGCKPKDIGRVAVVLRLHSDEFNLANGEWCPTEKPDRVGERAGQGRRRLTGPVDGQA